MTVLSVSSLSRAVLLVLAIYLLAAVTPRLVGAQFKDPTAIMVDDKAVKWKSPDPTSIEGHHTRTNASIQVEPPTIYPTKSVIPILLDERKEKPAESSIKDGAPASNASSITTEPTAPKSKTLLINEWSRAFPVWNRSATSYSWCRAQEEGKVSGMLFVKVNKCASSTGMGVSLRIADTLSQRVLLGSNNNTSPSAAPCFTRYNHGFASTGDRNYQNRMRERSVLWSILRHPAPRILSAYFFYKASRKNQNATEEAILKFAQDPEFQTHYVNYLRLKNFKTREEEIAHLIKDYDFIAVSERMGESIVVLSLLLKVPLADMIVLSSKQAGGYDDGRSRKGCVKLKKKWSTPAIDKYLYGDFLADNPDYLLYQTVNASLDKTIEALGAKRVAAGVERYKALSQKNDAACRSHSIFPCPIPPGEDVNNHTLHSHQDCYFSDAGCGHKCTDEALRVNANEEWKAFQSSPGQLQS